MDVQEQRVRFVVAASRREKRFGALCQEFQVSRPAGYVCLRRYQEQGLAGIAERSRRPHLSPRQTGDAWEQQVVELRQRYPDWGARKLQVLLAQAGGGFARQHHPPHFVAPGDGGPGSAGWRIGRTKKC